MAPIVLATLNARYAHSAFGLRYLLANMGELRSSTRLMEFVISDHSVEILAAILAEEPSIVGLGIYIWNVEPTYRLVTELKRLRPDIRVILGGPEVSYELEDQPIVAAADYVIPGEADLRFAELCREILDGRAPSDKLQPAQLPSLDNVRLPYEEYSDDDIAHRVIYVEISRGCPFTCEFCLSSLDIPVRMFQLDAFLQSMQRLLDRGARQFKFVDRTFNLNLRISQAILEFFHQRLTDGMFLHFEMIPDRLPASLREWIARFPPGSLQLEIGVQTFNDDVGERISRRQNVAQLEDNFRYLRQHTGAHLHADLIVGLPGESLESFGRGFDRLFALKPQEIQVGILKRLRGTPIARHEQSWEMVYSPFPPYEILSHRMLGFEEIHRLRRFARFWDLIGNSGHFPRTLGLLCPIESSPFERLLALSDWLYERNHRTYAIALVRLFESIYVYLSQVLKVPESLVAETLWEDYRGGGKRECPWFLKAAASRQGVEGPETRRPPLPSRQARHLLGGGEPHRGVIE